MAYCKNCKVVGCYIVQPSNVDHKCKLYEPYTHGDAFREMTDEELTKVFIDLMHGNCFRPTSECFGECEACLLEWLKREENFKSELFI